MSEDTWKAAGTAVGTAIGSAVAGSAGGVAGAAGGYKTGGDVGAAFNASAPTPMAPTVMPVRGDAADKAARRKSIAAQKARRGRASTILTNSESLG